MNPKQEARLRVLCEQYDVPFDFAHYSRGIGLPDGYVAGWVGGPTYANPAYVNTPNTGRHTIYVGVSPEGESSS